MEFSRPEYWSGKPWTLTDVLLCVWNRKVRVFPVSQPTQVAKWRSRKVCRSPHEQPRARSWGVWAVSGTRVWFPALQMAGAQRATAGGGSTTLCRLPDWRPEAADVKLGRIFPPRAPALLDLFTYKRSLSRLKDLLPQAGGALNLPGSTPISTLWFLCLLCELLKWPLPPSDWKLTRHFLDYRILISCLVTLGIFNFFAFVFKK